MTRRLGLNRRLLVLAAIVMMVSAGLRQPARAEDEFYKGKVVTIISHTTPGSIYDTYARLLARFLPDHIPGHPTVIVKNLPGAGGLTAVRFLLSVAPKDGTTIGTVTRTLVLEPLLGKNVVGVDYSQFGWLGSMARSTALYVSWHTSKIKRADQLLQEEMLIAGTGGAAETTITTSVLNGVLGTKIKLIQGYNGSVAGLLAMERGEVEGGFPTLEAIRVGHEDWLRDKQINMLFQTNQTPDPQIADVPTVFALAKTDQQREALRFMFPRDVLGRPFVAPPGVPGERLAILQQAFEQALADPALLDEAKKIRVTIDMASGKEVASAVAELYATPKEIIERVRKFVPTE